jgi:hypothetical protein
VCSTESIDLADASDKKRKWSSDDEEDDDCIAKRPKLDDTVSSDGPGPASIRRARAARPIPSKKRGGLAVPQSSRSGHGSPTFQVTDLLEPDVEGQPDHSEAQVPSEDVGQYIGAIPEQDITCIGAVTEQPVAHTEAAVEPSVPQTEAVAEPSVPDVEAVAEQAVAYVEGLAELTGLPTEAVAEETFPYLEPVAQQDVTCFEALVNTGHESSTDEQPEYPSWETVFAEVAGPSSPMLHMNEQGPATDVSQGEAYVEQIHPLIAEPSSPVFRVNEQEHANDVGQGQGHIEQVHRLTDDPSAYSWLHYFTSQAPAETVEAAPTGQPFTAAFTNIATIGHPMILGNHEVDTLVSGETSGEEANGAFPAFAGPVPIYDAAIQYRNMFVNHEVGTIGDEEISGEEADGVYPPFAAALPHVDAGSGTVPIEGPNPLSTAASSPSSDAQWSTIVYSGVDAKIMRRHNPPSSYLAPNPVRCPLIPTGRPRDNFRRLPGAALKAALIAYAQTRLVPSSLCICNIFLLLRYRRQFPKTMKNPTRNYFVNGKYLGRGEPVPPVKQMESKEVGVAVRYNPGGDGVITGGDSGSSSSSSYPNTTGVTGEVYFLPEPQPFPPPEPQLFPAPELEPLPSLEPGLFPSESSSCTTPQMELDPDLDVTSLMDRQSSTDTDFLGAEASHAPEASTSYPPTQCSDDFWPAPPPDKWSQPEGEVRAVHEPLAGSSGTREQIAYQANSYPIPSGSTEQSTGETSWDSTPWANLPKFTLSRVQFPSLPAHNVSTESSLSCMVQVSHSSTSPLETNVADDVPPETPLEQPPLDPNPAPDPYQEHPPSSS